MRTMTFHSYQQDGLGGGFFQFNDENGSTLGLDEVIESGVADILNIEVMLWKHYSTFLKTSL